MCPLNEVSLNTGLHRCACCDKPVWITVGGRKLTRHFYQCNVCTTSPPQSYQINPINRSVCLKVGDASVWDASTKDGIVQGMHRPRDKASRGRIIQGTHCPMAGTSQNFVWVPRRQNNVAPFISPALSLFYSWLLFICLMTTSPFILFHGYFPPWK